MNKNAIFPSNTPSLSRQFIADSLKNYKLMRLNHVYYSLLNLRAITTQKCKTHRLDHFSRRLLLEGPLLDLESCLVDLLK